MKALKLASDLDASVEEKLLVGDRPKPSNLIDAEIPLMERLSTRNQEEMNEVDVFNILSISAKV